jgi:hypothetical protein
MFLEQNVEFYPSTVLSLLSHNDQMGSVTASTPSLRESPPPSATPPSTTVVSNIHNSKNLGTEPPLIPPPDFLNTLVAALDSTTGPSPPNTNDSFSEIPHTHPRALVYIDICPPASSQNESELDGFFPYNENATPPSVNLVPSHLSPRYLPTSPADVFHNSAKSHPLPMCHIDPNVSFKCPAFINNVGSSFSVFIDDLSVPVHREMTTLVCSGSQPSLTDAQCEFLYTTTLVPGYWSVLCNSSSQVFFLYIFLVLADHFQK